MLKNKVESFQIHHCPLCDGDHPLDLDVYREILPNDPDKDVRVPEFKKIHLELICPVKKDTFSTHILIQEDCYSKVIKLRRI